MSDSLSSSRPAGRAFLALLITLTFLINTIGRGVTETFAVFLLPMQSSLDVSRPEITATYSIYMLAYGLAAPFAGQLIDRLGARTTYGLGLLALGGGYYLAGGATTVWHYYASVGVLGGLGSAALGMVVASSLLSRWFTERIGSVMSLPYAAIGAGMLLFPPLTQILIDTHGAREAHRLLGVGVLALLPLLIVLPLGRASAGSDVWRAQRLQQAQTAAGPWTVSTAVRTSAFWGLFSAYFWTSVAAYSVLPQSVAYLVEQGFKPLLAASAFGLAGALSAVGVILVGWLSDRLGRRATVTFTYILSIIGTTSLILVAVMPSLVLVYGFVVCFGLMQGARGPIIVALIAVLFRGGAVGSIFGVLSLALGTGAGVGSLVSGWLQQATGAYTASFLLGVFGSLMGLAMFWLVPSLRNEQPPAVKPRRGSGETAGQRR